MLKIVDIKGHLYYNVLYSRRSDFYGIFYKTYR